MNKEILQRFTENLKEALAHAVTLSLEFGDGEVGPNHILLGLLHQSGSVSAEVLSSVGITREKLAPKPSTSPNTSIVIPQFTPEAKTILTASSVIATEFHHRFVGTEHVLLAIIRSHQRMLRDLFPEVALDMKDLERRIELLMKNTSRLPDLTEMFGSELAAPDESATPALDFFTVELTDSEAQLDPVIGRDQEIDRMIHILSRRTKNNPLLIGEPGVGKTALAEGLANRIVSGDIPAALAEKRVFQMDLGSIVAGTMYRGEFEARMKQVIDELTNNPDFILFIDEIHTIVNAGGAQGAIDAANLLKPALARGEIHCIGATTLEEYQKTIERDKALNRRFQNIEVKEPNEAETLEILEGMREHYESFHCVTLTPAAEVEAVKLSSRYIHDNQLPDKALDIIDEASALCRLEHEPKQPPTTLTRLKARLSKMKDQESNLLSSQSFDKAKKINSLVRDLEDELSAMEKEIETEQRQTRIVTPEYVARIVSKVTGIPVSELLSTDLETVAKLKEELEQFVYGQPEAIERVAQAVKRSRLGIRDPKRPVASFLFLGPSGVGKTELGKTLARSVYGSEDSLIRVDMSEFRESFNMSKLLGAPAGYVGYKEQTTFTDRIRRQPYSVILFDEVEKAHPDVLNLLLQILEDGIVTDASGRKVHFNETIIVLTSNIGTQDMLKEGLGFGSESTLNHDAVEQTALRTLNDTFRPEILNRIDATVVFRALTKEAAVRIVEKQLTELGERLSNREVRITTTKQAKELLAERGTSPKAGARQIRRTIEERVESPLVDELLSKDAGKRFKVTTENGEVVVKKV